MDEPCECASCQKDTDVFIAWRCYPQDFSKWNQVCDIYEGKDKGEGRLQYQ